MQKFCKYICKNICKKMCKMCKKCVKKIFPCVKVLQNFCTFQIYTEILDHVKRALECFWFISKQTVDDAKSNLKLHKFKLLWEMPEHTIHFQKNYPKVVHFWAHSY